MIVEEILNEIHKGGYEHQVFEYLSKCLIKENTRIDKEDLPKLIRGEELSLAQGKARAFKIEIVGGLTNGDMVKIIFKPYSVTEIAYGYHVFLTENDYKTGEWLNYSKAWWNAPYMEVEEE